MSTNVPDTNATPSSTATDVSRKRTFFDQIPLRVTFHMGRPYAPRRFILSSTPSAVGASSSSTM